jgi:nucleoside-diphosphate-sugar epimerase
MSDRSTSISAPATQLYKRVVVTGTSGFIAGHLAAALIARGYEVLGLDLTDPRDPVDGVRYVRCDLREGDAVATQLKALAPQAVLHLAARTDLNETRNLNGYAANIAGVEHLVAAIRATPSVARAICTSSQLVCKIGYRASGDEDYRPSTLYGESKVRTEQLWRGNDGGGTEWCLVRPTTIWGPRMNPHYLRFFEMVRDGRYRHIGRRLTFKFYGYVGNTVWQYIRLLEAPTAAIQRRVFYLADYEPVTLEAWADAFQAELAARPIRRLPLSLARAAATVGDLVNLIGFKRFPFNSFRLNNVLTPNQVDVGSTRAVCGELPYTMQAGVVETVRWLRSVWAARGSPQAT